MAGGVVQVVQRIIPGGIEVLALNLSARLPGENRVLSLEWTNAQIVANWPALADPPCPFEGLGKPPGFQPGIVLTLAKRFRALKPRAVMAHHIGPLIYAGLAARLAGVPRFVYVEHDVWHYEAANDSRLARFVSALVRPKVVAVSQSLAQAVAAVMPSCDISVIPNAVDTDRFVPGDRTAARRRLGLPLEARIIGAAGRLEHVKGQDVLVAAMLDVPDTILAVVGDGSTAADLKAQAAALGLEGRVRFLGHRSDMPDVYPAFDIAVLPSRNEGLPLSVLEAQACGIRVVATDVGSVREGIAPDCSVLVPPEDPQALAGAINRLLAEPSQSSPRPFVLKHFSWASMVHAYEALLGPAPEAHA